MTFKECIERLREAGIDTPEHEARELFIRFADYPRDGAIFDQNEASSEELSSAIERRCAREPLQYIVGEVGFYRELYSVSPDCLIPRADTETLVDFAVKALKAGARFLDVCTGSGCIAVSTLKNTVATTAVALDISYGALDIAAKNAAKNGVTDRIEFLRMDALAGVPDGKFDAILSNPPYVSQSEYEALAPELYFEPKLALLGGEDGADFYRYMIPSYKKCLTDGGFMAFEIGASQGALLTSLAAENGMLIEIIKDLSGNDRVAVLREA